MKLLFTVFLITINPTHQVNLDPLCSHCICDMVILTNEEDYLKYEYENSDMIVTASVKSIKHKYANIPGSSKIITFTISKTFKGESLQSYKMENEPNGCSYYFEKGNTYLIYFYSIDGEYITSRCNRTRLLKDAESDIMFLKEKM